MKKLLACALSFLFVAGLLATMTGCPDAKTKTPTPSPTATPTPTKTPTT